MMFRTGGAGLVRWEGLRCQDLSSTGDLAVRVRTWFCGGADEHKCVLQPAVTSVRFQEGQAGYAVLNWVI